MKTPQDMTPPTKRLFFLIMMFSLIAIIMIIKIIMIIVILMIITRLIAQVMGRRQGGAGRGRLRAARSEDFLNR